MNVFSRERPFPHATSPIFGAVALVFLGAAAAGCSDVGDSTALPAAPNGTGDEVTLVDGSMDEGGSQSAARDATVADAGVEEASPQDVAIEEFTAADTSPPDVTVEETGVPEAGELESGSDATILESGADVGGSTPLDGSIEDTGVSDTSVKDTGAEEAGEHDATTDQAAPSDAAVEAEVGTGGTGPLLPCTTLGQMPDCVSCSGNENGVCSSTEAVFVQLDISSGFVTAPGPDSFTAATLGCYGCLVANDCLDSVVDNNSPNLECDDLSGTITNGEGATVAEPSACLDVVSCIAGVAGGQCGLNTAGLSYCYCGPGGGPSTNCVSHGADANGACFMQEVSGFSYAPNDSADILKSFGSRTQPSGVANDIFTCALANGCNTCME